MTHLQSSNIPVAAASKVSCSDRSYIYDTSGYLRNSIHTALYNICTVCGGVNVPTSLGAADCVDRCQCSAPLNSVLNRRFHANPRMRVLDYRYAGGDLAPHVDLSKKVKNSLDHKVHASTHTFIIYLQSTSDFSGETVLLDKHCSGMSKILASVSPVRNRILVFPHDCPHAGLKGIALYC